MLYRICYPCLIYYINFFSISSTAIVINVGLLVGDTFGSLQANKLFTMCSCSVLFKDCPFLIAKLFAIDFASKSAVLKLASGTSFSTSLINCSKIIDTSLSGTPTGTPVIVISFHLTQKTQNLCVLNLLLNLL